MSQHYHRGARIHVFAGKSLLERVLLGVVGLAVLILAFFFLTIALVAGALLAGVILARWWWITRKMRAAQDEGVIEGDYTTVEREGPGRIEPPRER